MVPAEEHQVTRWCGTCNSDITGAGEGRVLAPAIFLPSCHWHYSHLDQVSQTVNTVIIIIITNSVTRCDSVKERLSIAKGTGLYVDSSVIAQLDFFFIKAILIWNPTTRCQNLLKVLKNCLFLVISKIFPVHLLAGLDWLSLLLRNVTNVKWTGMKSLTINLNKEYHINFIYFISLWFLLFFS